MICVMVPEPHICQVGYKQCTPPLRLVLTPVFHLSGLGVGGIWGLREGYKRPLAVSNARLRINSILNSVTRRGTFLGNSAGVIGRLLTSILTFTRCNVNKTALAYNIINSSIDSFRGKHDIWGGMAAGGLTGAIYKSTSM